MKTLAVKLKFLFCLMLAVISLSSCNDDDLKNTATISAKKITLSKDRSIGVAVTYSDSAYVKAIGFAPILDKVTPSVGAIYNEMPKGVKIEFFDKFFKKTGTITSNYAIQKQTEKITIFRKNVIVVSDNITFTTEELTWDENKRMYYSPYGTVTTKDGDVITGTEFFAPQDFSTYEIIDAAGTTSIKGDLTQ
ncbi:LptA/OstA family protein [Pedobacter cryotolerans]|uniref:hypothetical protein n=1 Tax=Pedobacter cryotolerans TaxID=2571270 RepID=UPI001CEC8B56|nr:hypothetical protein [Pedobacter cryotolerans]